jgi:hypothetical protein
LKKADKVEAWEDRNGTSVRGVFSSSSPKIREMEGMILKPDRKRYVRVLGVP